MKKELAPVYLTMPISFEQKREWNAKGFKVLDIALMPEGFENPVEAEDKPKRSKSKEL